MTQVCFTLVRSVIIIENLIVATMASLLIYVSLSAMDQDFGMDSLQDNHPKNVHAYISAISTGVGVIIALLSILGLFGAIKRSRSVLTMYGAIIFFMITILAILAALTLTIRNDGVVYRDVDKSIVNSTIGMYNYTDSNDVKTKVLDYIQKRLSCCGINSPNDWKDYGLHKIPKSCCSNHIDNNNNFLNNNNKNLNNINFKHCEQSEYRIGCWRAMTDYFHANLSTTRTVLYMIIGFGLVCVLAAYFMVRFLRQSLEVV